MTRSRKYVIAAVASALWLGYMVVGLALINYFLPTVEGQGPAGAAAFVGLLTGFFVCGIVMWAASD
jgi:hypothetical protein